MIFVSKLPLGVTEADVKEIYAPYGTIEKITLLQGNPYYINAKVSFADESDKNASISVELAIRATNGKKLPEGNNLPIRVGPFIAGGINKDVIEEQKGG